MRGHLLKIIVIFILLFPFDLGAKHEDRYLPKEEKRTWNHWVKKRADKVKIVIPCEGYIILAPEFIEFSPNEKKLICGDPQVDAWQEIPRNQAIYNITNFLQDRGYYSPIFEQSEDRVTINAGDKTEIGEINVRGNYPETLDLKRRRGIKKNILTPARLSSLEGWVATELSNIGYPCADVSATADATTGTIYLDIEGGGEQKFPEIDIDQFEGFSPEALRRYDAFDIGKRYKKMLLSLTSRRIERDAIAQGSYFIPSCKDGTVNIRQRVVPGKPRLFIAGIGFDTEEYVKLKASWQHGRIGKNASVFKIKGSASYRRQKIDTGFFWHVFGPASRWFLTPQLSFEHRKERHYQYTKLDTIFLPGFSWDNNSLRLDMMFGPEFSHIRTYKGANKGPTHFLSLMTDATLKSHDFEYYDFDPRSGFVVRFSAGLNKKGVVSSVTVQKIETYFEWLYNLMDYDPTLFIFGIRGKIATSITDRSGPNFNTLPPDYLFYLGGSSDLRGFKRQELPITYKGALTAAYFGFEGRLTNVLPLNIQPIGFIDVGVMGERALNFDYPIYWSPGFGFRWPSFIGVIRLTFAHGFLFKNNNPANNKAEHWQVNFSYGEEF